MLKRSKDRKVTNAVSPNGKTAKIANSFGLPSGTAYSCPGATETCTKVCYAGKLEKIYKGTKDVLLHNWNLLINASFPEMCAMIEQMIVEFESDCDKHNAPKIFRIHWDGDFFSLEYAMAWCATIIDHPDTQFWVYTRSFTDKLNVVPVFGDIPNLAFYLSVDKDNSRFVGRIRRDHPWVKLAYMVDKFADNKDKSYNCPENGGRLPLITQKGSACARCGVCVTGRGNVTFSISKH